MRYTQSKTINRGGKESPISGKLSKVVIAVSAFNLHRLGNSDYGEKVFFQTFCTAA